MSKSVKQNISEKKNNEYLLTYYSKMSKLVK